MNKKIRFILIVDVARNVATDESEFLILQTRTLIQPRITRMFTNVRDAHFELLNIKRWTH